MNICVELLPLSLLHIHTPISNSTFRHSVINEISFLLSAFVIRMGSSEGRADGVGVSGEGWDREVGMARNEYRVMGGGRVG